MRAALRQILLPSAGILLCAAAIFWGIGAAIEAAMPGWRDSVGDTNHTEKLTGSYLLELSAAQEDTLLIFGSSELLTTQIPAHPANFFAGKRAGFQVDLIGRGSCQSLIHAIQLASLGDDLESKKVVLITSPQSYVEEGIAPDMFAANFSPQQFRSLLNDPKLSQSTKAEISARVAELLTQYQAMPDAAAIDPAIRLLAAHTADPSALSAVGNGILAPYHWFNQYLDGLKDQISVRPILVEGQDTTVPQGIQPIDWVAEEQAALESAAGMTQNNDFGMLDDYYTTYIGSRLERQANRDQDLSYSHSKEYDDLRLLFEVCRQKGVQPLFVHVPLHGQWSDYTGFTATRRAEYYQNVRQIAEEYGVQMLDLTGYEYDPYFMCDTMHLGWKGWLEVDKAIIDYYHGR